MLGYLVHRILIMIPTLIAISLLIFIIIHLPPGDYFSTYIAELQSQGEKANLAKIAVLRAFCRVGLCGSRGRGVVGPAFFLAAGVLGQPRAVLARFRFPGLFFGPGGHRRHDPAIARQSARRIAEAVRRNGPSQGSAP